MKCYFEKNKNKQKTSQDYKGMNASRPLLYHKTFYQSKIV